MRCNRISNIPIVGLVVVPQTVDRRNEMPDDVHRRALRATAKIALSLTVVGCGGRVEIPAPAGDDAGAGGAPVTSTPSPSTTTGNGGAPVVQTTTGQGGAGGVMVAACEPTDPTAPVSLDPQSFGCCVDHLTNQTQAAWQSPDEQTLGCCHEVVGQIDQDPSLLAQIDESLVAPVWPDDGSITCCEVLGNPCTMPCGCTVWGPPIPYRLPGRLPSLDELEVA
jgi:hypothetical protein